MLLSPEMGGLATNIYGSKYGFFPKFAKKLILLAIFVTKPPISGLSNINKSWIFDENVQLIFYKVFTEIGSLGFTKFDGASKRTHTSK